MSDSGRDDGLPSRTRAHRGGGRSPREGPPGRETREATSTYRSGFLGIGNRAGSERDRLGALLADLGRLVGEVGTLTLPTLLSLPFVSGREPIALFEAWLVGLTTMIVVATLIRNGRIASLPFTDAPGWARLFPTLILLRLLYFNGALLAAVYGGVVVAGVTGAVSAGLVWASLVSGTATLLFPGAVDGWMAGRA